MMTIALLACANACGSGDDDDDDQPSAGTSGGESGKGGGAAGAGTAGSAAGSGGGATAGSGGKTGPRMAYPAGLVGDFRIKLQEEVEPSALDEDGQDAVTSVLAILYDGPKPKTMQRHMTAQAGECKLYEPFAPTCTEKCSAMNAVCTDDDVCTPQPNQYGVGTVDLTVGTRNVELEYIAKNYQLAAGDSLPYPPCEPGAPVKLQAEGGDYEPFTIESKCIDLLEVEGPFAMEPGKPFKLIWSKPADTSLSRVEVVLDIAHHGGERGEIECDLPDTGSYDIPAELIDKLLDLGVAGFPTVQLARVASAHAKGEPAKVTLSLGMPVERPVTIPGLVSCASDDRACPMGMTCQSDLTCK